MKYLVTILLDAPNLETLIRRLSYNYEYDIIIKIKLIKETNNAKHT